MQCRRKEQKNNPDIMLSKSLSWILRHGAVREGLKLEEGGYAYVDEILSRRPFRSYTVHDVVRVVETNDKKRFALQTHPGTGRLQIRANQGHSIDVVDDGTLLIPLTMSQCPDMVVHGTYLHAWNIIQREGISRMKRKHIHFATGFPRESCVISGMRDNSDIAIVIDAYRAMFDGMEFFRSRNNVILSPGNKNGFIPPEYFKEVWKLRPSRERMF